MPVGTGVNPLPQGLAIIDLKNGAATKEFWWFLIQLQNRKAWISETLGTIGDLTPSGGATYHVIEATGDIHIKAPSNGSAAGQPHIFKITLNGFAVTWDAAYIGLTGVALVATAAHWNTLTFTTETNLSEFNYSSSILGES